MEGALVVVKKDGSALSGARVVFVEALHHNNFGHYETGEGSPIVNSKIKDPFSYIEPKGHGIEAFTGDKKQVAKQRLSALRLRRPRSRSHTKEDKVCRDLETTPCDKSVGYDLVSLSTLWAKAKGETNSTFGVTFDYGEIKISTSLNGNSSAEKAIKLGEGGMRVPWIQLAESTWPGLLGVVV